MEEPVNEGASRLSVDFVLGDHLPVNPFFGDDAISFNELYPPEHLHNKSRRAYISLDRVVQPAPAPKYANAVADRPRKPRSFKG